MAKARQADTALPARRAPDRPDRAGPWLHIAPEVAKDHACQGQPDPKHGPDGQWQQVLQRIAGAPYADGDQCPEGDRGDPACDPARHQHGPVEEHPAAEGGQPPPGKPDQSGQRDRHARTEDVPPGRQRQDHHAFGRMGKRRAGQKDQQRGKTAHQRRPSSPLISATSSPPMRECTRGPLAMTSPKTISSALGPSGTETVIASKWLRT